MDTLGEERGKTDSEGRVVTGSFGWNPLFVSANSVK